MIAGPNGSGKTTLTDQLRRDGVDFGRYINPDEIAKTLSGEYSVRVRKAQMLADQDRERCLRRLENFSFETVMSHPSKVDVLRRAKERGFHVIVYFVATESPDLNVARVAQRVALGGHDVPEDRIRERYGRALALLPEALSFADETVLFDNSYALGPAETAVLRPFCRRAGPEWTLAPPVPGWALRSLKDWLPPLRPL